MQRWPDRLWVVRHGESAGNVARDAAHAAGEEEIEIKARDVDVALSALGEKQSRALGRWFAALPVAIYAWFAARYVVNERVAAFQVIAAPACNASSKSPIPKFRHERV